MLVVLAAVFVVHIATMVMLFVATISNVSMKMFFPYFYSDSYV